MINPLMAKKAAVSAGNASKVRKNFGNKSYSAISEVKSGIQSAAQRRLADPTAGAKTDKVDAPATPANGTAATALAGVKKTLKV